MWSHIRRNSFGGPGFDDSYNYNYNYNYVDNLYNYVHDPTDSNFRAAE